VTKSAVSVQTPSDASVRGDMPGSKIWLVPIGFCVTRAWQKCENARSISFSPFQCFSIVLEGQKLYELVEDVHTFLAMYFFSQFVELLWAYFLYCAMCENTPSVIVCREFESLGLFVYVLIITDLSAYSNERYERLLLGAWCKPLPPTMKARKTTRNGVHPFSSAWRSSPPTDKVSL